MPDPDSDRGLYKKVHVRHLDGSSEPGGKHERCEYFALDLSHDGFAGPALIAYAEACVGRYPRLAADLVHKVLEYRCSWALTADVQLDIESRALRLLNDISDVEAPPF